VKILDKVVSKKYILAMKKGILWLFSVLVIASAVYASAYLYGLQAWNENDDVRLEWKTLEEVNLQNFVVERKSPQSSYIEIATIPPKGNNSYYSYLDESAYKTEGLIFIYRIKIISTNEQDSYSNAITVDHNVSGVKRTWGSIKEMFR
jgi:hypothetical protein